MSYTSIGLRQHVWHTYIGIKNGEIKCPMCLINTISQLSFICGHVLAKINGGECTLENLRPICSVCNSCMGAEHMTDYIKRRFPKSPMIRNLPKNPSKSDSHVPIASIYNESLLPQIKSDGKHPCPSCQKNFTRKDTLERHIKDKICTTIRPKKIDLLKTIDAVEIMRITLEQLKDKLARLSKS